MPVNISNQKKYFTHWITFTFIAVVTILIGFDKNVSAANTDPKTFKSPDEAVEALVEAVKADDTKELLAIFGAAGKELIFSGDRVADKTERERFIKAYEEMNRLPREDDRRAILHVGNQDWPFPIPIVKKGGDWRFEAREGKEEILNRRIGRNELNAIQVCLAYVDAQREYVLKRREKGNLPEYAQRFVSEKGKKNGL